MTRERPIRWGIDSMRYHRPNMVIWEIVDGDRGDDQGTGGVTPLGGAADYGDHSETRGSRRVVVPIGSGGNGNRGAPPHWGVHQEATGNHSGEGGLPPRICTMHGGRADAGDKPVGTMVGSRRGK